jgi:hypothetical protein
VLDRVFAEQAGRLPMLFDPNAPGVALRPSAAAVKRCMALLSGTEEKDRVFEKVRTVKGAKIAGADIVPATQLYTEDNMVKVLVQNSLGATWMGMHPESKLYERWEYYVGDADRAERNDEAHAKAQSCNVEELNWRADERRWCREGKLPQSGIWPDVAGTRN